MESMDQRYDDFEAGVFSDTDAQDEDNYEEEEEEGTTLFPSQQSQQDVQAMEEDHYYMYNNDNDDEEETSPTSISISSSAAAAADDASSSRKRKSRVDDDDDDINNNNSTEKCLGIHMKITDQEREWAKAIKEAASAAEEEEEVNNNDNTATARKAATARTTTICDMEYVQYAIIENGNVTKALERIRKMKAFRRQYDIQDTVDDGIERIREFMIQQPGFSINVDQCVRHDHYVHVVDFAKFQPRTIRLEKDWKIFMSGLYYYMCSLNPTLSAVRSGVLVIMECEGMGWNNFCIEFERRLWYEHPTAYPFRFREISWVRTPLVGNVFFSLLKRVLPREVQEVIHLGVRFDDSFDGRLDTLFLQPSIEIANERQIHTLQKFLQQHYYNRQYFRL